MSEKEEYARLMRRSLEDNAHERHTYIKMALDSLSDADKASDKEVLDMTREIIKSTFRGEVGTKLAINIANGVGLNHIKCIQGQHPTSKGKSPCFLFFLRFLLRGAKYYG